MDNFCIPKSVINRLYPLILTLLVFALTNSSFFTAPPKAHKTESCKVAVLVSRHIKPYMDALKGVRESLAENASFEASVYILDQEILEHPAVFMKELLFQQFDIFISIGPEALSLLDQTASEHEIQNVYTMVLDPKKISSSHNLLKCGISLSIPIYHQIRDIRQALPHVKRIGLLFNPEENSAYYIQASMQSLSSNLSIVPLRVSSSREIQEVLQANWDRIDGLWLIPDQTVISQALVQFIIKEALFHKKVVVGYNRFFYDSGAAMAFILDYEQIGERTADLVPLRLKGLPCGQMVPSYEVLVNNRVMRRLGLVLTEHEP